MSAAGAEKKSADELYVGRKNSFGITFIENSCLRGFGTLKTYYFIKLNHLLISRIVSVS